MGTRQTEAHAVWGRRHCCAWYASSGACLESGPGQGTVARRARLGPCAVPKIAIHFFFVQCQDCHFSDFFFQCQDCKECNLDINAPCNLDIMCESNLASTWKRGGQTRCSRLANAMLISICWRRGWDASLNVRAVLSRPHPHPPLSPGELDWNNHV